MESLPPPLSSFYSFVESNLAPNEYKNYKPKNRYENPFLTYFQPLPMLIKQSELGLQALKKKQMTRDPMLFFLVHLCFTKPFKIYNGHAKCSIQIWKKLKLPH